MQYSDRDKRTGGNPNTETNKHKGGIEERKIQRVGEQGELRGGDRSRTSSGNNPCIQWLK